MLPETSRLDHVTFNSRFEGGNLDLAVKINDYEYDLFIRVDSNTKGHINWYNFKVSNFPEDAAYKFNIVNFTKKILLYDQGMRPFVKRNKEPWK